MLDSSCPSGPRGCRDGPDRSSRPSPTPCSTKATRSIRIGRRPVKNQRRFNFGAASSREPRTAWTRARRRCRPSASSWATRGRRVDIKVRFLQMAQQRRAAVARCARSASSRGSPSRWQPRGSSHARLPAAGRLHCPAVRIEVSAAALAAGAFRITRADRKRHAARRAAPRARTTSWCSRSLVSDAHAAGRRRAACSSRCWILRTSGASAAAGCRNDRARGR